MNFIASDDIIQQSSFLYTFDINGSYKHFPLHMSHTLHKNVRVWKLTQAVGSTGNGRLLGKSTEKVSRGQVLFWKDVPPNGK